MEGFEYVTAIKDQMSAPAHDAKAALHALGAEIQKTEKEILALQKAQKAWKDSGAKLMPKKLGSEIQDLRLKQKGLRLESAEMGHQVKESAGIFGQLTSSLIPEVAIGELAAEGFKKLAEGALEAAKAVGELVLEGAKFALEASEFKENMSAAYALFGESADEGERTYEAVGKIAKELPIPEKQAHEIAKDLLFQGIEDKVQMQETIKAVANLQKVAGEQAGGRLRTIIDRALDTGKLTLKKKDLKSIGGDALKTFYADLSKQLGVSQDTIKKQLEQGGVDASQGINALDAAINKGKIGKLAGIEVGDLSQSVQKLKDEFMHLFDGIDIKPFTQELQYWVQLFDQNSESGSVMKDTVTTAFNAIFQAAAYAFRAVRHGFLDIEIFALKTELFLAPVILALEKIHNKGDVIKEVFKSIATAAVGPIAQLGSAIESGAALVKAAGEKLGVAHVEGVKEGLDAHSPSREMMKIGRDAHEGFAIGVEKNEQRSGGAMQFATRPQSFEPTSPYSGNASKPTVQVHLGGIQIHGVPNAEAILPMLEPALADLIERINMEAGQ